MGQILLFSVGIFGEPAFADTLALFENFADTPERGESEDTEEDREIGIVYKERASQRQYPDNQECPPRAHAEIVLRFDDQRMEEADAQECACAKKNTFEIHINDRT